MAFILILFWPVYGGEGVARDETLGVRHLPMEDDAAFYAATALVAR